MVDIRLCETGDIASGFIGAAHNDQLFHIMGKTEVQRQCIGDIGQRRDSTDNKLPRMASRHFTQEFRGRQRAIVADLGDVSDVAKPFGAMYVGGGFILRCPHRQRGPLRHRCVGPKHRQKVARVATGLRNKRIAKGRGQPQQVNLWHSVSQRDGDGIINTRIGINDHFDGAGHLRFFFCMALMVLPRALSLLLRWASVAVLCASSATNFIQRSTRLASIAPVSSAA